MDSLTQACVGAVIGELCLGKRLGWKAPLWGAIIGTIPDMDIIANPWLETHEEVRWHRGWSHGIFGLLLGTGIGSAWLRWRHQIGWPLALWVSALVLFFNILVDCFNSYGTQLYEPFSDQRIAWNLLFIIDPLFTLPLLLAIIIGRILHWRQSDQATAWISGGIALSVLYLMVAIANKVTVNERFQDSLEAQGFTVQQWFSAPTPFNTLYWRAVAQAENKYYIAYACPWDAADSIQWVSLPAQHHLAAQHMDTAGVQTVQWSSLDYWTASTNEAGQLLLTDIRFGDRWFGRPGHGQEVDHGVWVFALSADGGLERVRPNVRDLDAALSFLWDRICRRQQSGP